MTRLVGLAQALAAGHGLLTATYCLLASLPFAYEQFLAPELLPPLAAFAHWHPWVNLTVFAAWAAIRWAAEGRPRGIATRAVYFAWGALSAVLLVAPPLAAVTPGTLARVLTLGALLLVLLLGVMDVEGADAIPPAPEVDSRADRAAPDFLACVTAGTLATAIYGILAMTMAGSIAPLEPRAGGTGALVGLLSQILLFLAVFATLTAIRAIASMTTRRTHVEAALTAVALAGVLALVGRSLVFPSLSLSGPFATLASVGFGAALALVIAGRGLRQSQDEADGVLRVAAALEPRAAATSTLAFVAWIPMLGIVAAGFEATSRAADWNFVVSRIGVVAVWLLLTAACLRSIRTQYSGGPAVLFGLALAALAMYLASTSAPARRWLSGIGVDMPPARSAWTGRDPASRLLTDVLTPPVDGDRTFLDFLNAHTNIPRSVSVPPVPVTLAPLSGAPSAYRPHIFLIVVDSLRRDYLGAYNADVTFTPALDAFGAESTVFANAFTRYGGTGLSVPAIFVGGRVLHKQYVTPFAPMNALAALLQHEGYAQWVGMDNILDVILPKTPALAPLDAQRAVKDFRLCTTLEEIRQRIAGRAPGDPPIFAYTLPQDIHVSVIAREGSRAIDDGVYGGFSPPVASRVARFDQCFGAFIDHLKSTGIYDDSLIVVTSDHGDSLGEEGRQGHAYTIFPEIVRIPLLIRLPTRLASAWLAAPAHPAFSTDVTPTIYRLLGHEPTPPSAIFGVPLYGRGSPPPPRHSAGELLASSYGSVYGALLDDATRLFIIDGINGRDYTYALDGSASGRRLDVTPRDRVRGHDVIRRGVEDLALFFDFTPAL